ncbi:MAG: hypothetical protein V1873_02835 [Verrucomicrobiota bacterium]
MKRVLMFLLSAVLLSSPFATRAETAAAAPLVVRSATYEASLGAEYADFRAEYDIDVLQSDGEVRAPLLWGPVALSSHETSSRDVRLVREDGVLYAVARARGRYRISLEFTASVKELQDVWKTLRFDVGPAVVSEIVAASEGEDSKVELLSGTTAAVEHSKGFTRLTGYLGSAPSVSLRWQAKVKEKKVAPVILCNVHQLAEISASVLNLSARLAYEVPQGETTTLEADIDRALTVVRVAGENLRDWAIEEREGKQHCRVELLRPVSGQYVLEIFGEQPIKGLPAELVLPAVTASGVERQGGTVGLVSKDVVLSLNDTKGLSRINTDSFVAMGRWPGKDLAQALQSAFRFSQPGYRCAVGVTGIEPEITAQYRTAAEVGERRLQVRSEVSLEVKKAGVFAAEFEIPAELSVTDVKGPGVENWNVDSAAAASVLRISFGRKILGSSAVTVLLERTYDALPGALSLTGLRGKGIREEKGTLSISPASGIEVREDKADGLRPIAVSALAARRGDEALAFEFRGAAWTLALKTEALASRVTAEVFNLVTIGDGFLGGSATINYVVEKAGIQEFVLKIPKSWQNVDVTGVDIRRRTQADGTWHVALQDRVLGKYTLLITYDQPFDPNSDVIMPTGLTTERTEQESGYVVVTSGSQLEVGEAAGTVGLRRIDARELPAQYLAFIENPILRAYSYARPPYTLKLQTVRHREQKALEAIADRVKLVTVASKTGRRETQVTYLIKNNVRDSLRVALPEKAELWTAFVDGEAVKPEISGGAVVIPLKKNENRDLAYPVELVYIEQGKAMSRFFSTPLKLAAPLADVQGSFAEWEVYLPQWVRAVGFGGNMKPDREYVYSLSTEVQKAGGALDELFLRHRGFLIFVGVLAFVIWALVHSSRKGRGLRLVEVLVVVGILWVLAGLLLPAMSSAMRRGARVAGMSNLRQVGAALKMYAADNEGNLPDTLDDLVGRYVESDKVLIDPETGERMEYYGAGLKDNQVRADMPLAMSSQKEGATVLLADGSVQWYSPSGVAQEVLPKIHGLQVAAQREVEAVLPPAAPATLGIEMAPGVGEGALAAGLLPIRVELPKEGRVWRFSKVLNAGNDPLTLNASLVSVARVRYGSMAAAAVLFLAGLLAARKAQPSSSVPLYATSIALLFLSVWSLFAANGLLFYLLVAVPALIALAAFVGVLRRSPPPLAPGGTGASTSAGAGGTPMLLLLFAAGMLAAPSARAEEEAAPPPALAAQVMKAEYDGTVTENVASFRGHFEIEVVAPASGKTGGGFQPAEMHFLGTDVALRDVTTRGRDMQCVPYEKGFKLFIPRPGTFTVEIGFLAAVQGDASQKRLAFDLPASVSSVMGCSIDEKEATVESATAVAVKKEFVGDRTQVHLFLGPVSRLDLTWVPRVKRAGEVKVAAFCQADTLVSIEEGAVRLLSAFRYQVTQGELLSARVRLPGGLRLLKVSGDKVLNWELKTAESGQDLAVDMKSPLTREDVLFLETEMPLGQLPASVAVVTPRALDVQRETGSLAFTSEAEINFTPSAPSGLQQIDPGEFPMPVFRPALPASSPGAATLAYHYRGPEFSLRLDISRMTPEIKAVAAQLARIEEKDMVLSATLRYDIRKAGLFELVIGLPDAFDIEDVSGASVKQWFDEGTGTSRVLRVTFAEKVRGEYVLQVRLRKRWEQLAAKVPVPAVVPLQVSESSGYVAVSAAFGITLASYEADKLTELPVSELPEQKEGAVLAFKYRESGWSLAAAASLAQPWVQADGTHTIRVAEGLMRVTADFAYTIENAPIDRFVLRVPEKAENIRIDGANIRERNQAGATWTVTLQSKVRGTYRLTARYDVKVPSGAAPVAVPFAQTAETEREQGVVLVCSGPTLHITEQSRSDQVLLPVDPRDLSAAVRAAAGEEIRAAYRYLRQGQSLVLDVQRYEAAEVLQANIEKAQLTGVLAEDGQMMTQVLLTLRNNAKQNLQVKLPKGSEVWSCFVAGEATRVAIKDDRILLPLVQTGKEEPSYDIEFTYVSRDRPLGKGRKILLEAPEVDIPMQNVRWDVYLPEGYAYGSFGGSTTRREDIAVTFKEFALGEYQSAAFSKIAASEVKAKKLAANAYEMAQKGDVVAARRQYKIAQQMSVSKSAEVDDQMQQLDRAEAYANVAAVQAGQDFTGAFQQRMKTPAKPSSAVQGQPTEQGWGVQAPAQQAEFVQMPQAVRGTPAPEASKLLAVAEEQARKIRKTQAVSVTKVTPLRISVPVRGIRYVFEQVLWVPKDAPVSVTMKAKRTSKKGFFNVALTAAAAGLFLGVFVSGWMQRKRATIVVAAVLLLVLYVFFVYG